MLNIAVRLLTKNSWNGGKVIPRRRNFVQIANRKYLPGSTGATFPKHLNPPRENFPVIVTAESAGVSENSSASECAEVVKSKFKTTLHKHGAILYRGFPLKGYKDFSSFFHGLGKFQSMEYIGGAAPRKQVSDDVYTASDEPPEICIEPHNEMAYMHIWPDVVRRHTLVTVHCIHRIISTLSHKEFTKNQSASLQQFQLASYRQQLKYTVTAQQTGHLAQIGDKYTENL